MDIAKYEYPDLKAGQQDWRWCHKYPYDIIMGNIPACAKMRQVAERHFRDMENHEFYMDQQACESIVAWFGFCPIIKGPKAGQPMELDPSQIFIACSLIGWKWTDDIWELDEPTGIEMQTRYAGYRRFNQFYGQVSRKYGKTTFIAGIKLYLMHKSNYGPRVYSLATKRDQAKEVWKVAKKMINKSPRLKSIFVARANDILLPAKEGEFIPLASDSNSLDGLDPMAGCLDECHAIKDANLYHVLVSAFGGNVGSEYLFSVITTAGFILDGLCVDLYKNGTAVLDQEIKQENYFYVIFELDKDDEWDDEKNWYKSNPALVYGRPSIQYVRDRFNEALTNYSEKANFLTKHCNLFVNGADKWLDMTKVKACINTELDLNDYKHKKCYLGFDRSLGGDVTSLWALFPEEDGGVTIFGWNMQAEGAVKEASTYLRKIYLSAEAKGDLIILKGTNRIRNKDVKNLIREVYEQLPLCEHVAYDPYKMKEVALDLEEEGLPMLSVSQGPTNLSEPTKKFESLVEDKLLRYNGDTMFNFACECAVMDVTKFNNVAVYKEDYKTEKIDPLIATLIALSSATLFSSNSSVYNHKSLLTI